MRIISWNVNGLRACVKKGFLDVLNGLDAEIFALQEVRAFEHQLDADVLAPEGWHFSLSSAERPGYSGVGLYSRSAPDHQETSLGDAGLDAEGRYQAVRFGRMTIINAYFPKGSGNARDNSRVPYKLGFYDAVFARMEQARQRGPVLVMGDYNTAHHEIDLARPRTNQKSSGFLPEERAVLDRWVQAGWKDTFRVRHPGEPGHYTWWRQWGNARRDNVGWRIDYIFASPSANQRIDEAFILPDIQGSDHCPVGVDMDI
ncbi:MAG: exodeoxyribonuclease III [Proteobacteria bacterium]|nr:exodeoxyribonuclease III [Pseudomonadota bacterium]MDA1302430.1 exodeoxyribonuclease III [Pseudomonadota bacterium]